MRHVFETMGTVASVDLADGWSPDLIRSTFDSIEARFSLYQPESELSRIADGRASLLTESETMRASYARAVDWRAATNGLFSPHRPDGVLDLNGIVKAEAIEASGALLDNAGCPGWAINVGGDILVSAGVWPTGIADPTDAAALLGSIDLGGRRRALATSGSAQRGDHIWRGATVEPTAFVQAGFVHAEFVQVSVVADDIVTADVLATAIVAGGPDALDDLTSRFDIDVLTVDRDGRMLATPGLRAKVPSRT